MTSESPPEAPASWRNVTAAAGLRMPTAMKADSMTRAVA